MPELDPETAAVLDTIDQLPRPPTHGLSVESARAALTEFFAGDEPYEAVGAREDFSIPGPEGDIPVRLSLPEAEGPHPVLVFFHGGGWVIGDLDTHDNVCSALCARAECAVLSVDYRLAPEHPFPAALSDCYAAVEWVHEKGKHVHVDPERIAVGGDSAGGNLSAAVSLMARDRDGPALAHQLLIYPAVASPALHAFDSYEENAEGYFLERASMDWFYERYAPHPADARNAYLAPLLARDLAGLPPATVLTAEFDPLRDEGRAYADRLADAGVPVERHHYEGQIHGFVSMTEFIGEADAALSTLADDLRAAF